MIWAIGSQLRRVRPVPHHDSRFICPPFKEISMKLTQLVMATSLALAGTAFAADNTGSPTVPRNTTDQGTSYSDKSTTAKGSNANMDNTSTSGAPATTNTTHAKKKAKKAKVDTSTSSSTSLGTSTDLSTSTNTGAASGTRSDTELSNKSAIGSGTTPSAPTPGAPASTVNDTQGKSGN
jgi:hypothetical protein